MFFDLIVVIHDGRSNEKDWVPRLYYCGGSWWGANFCWRWPTSLELTSVTPPVPILVKESSAKKDLKKGSGTGVFLFVKFLRTPFFIKCLRWLLLEMYRNLKCAKHDDPNLQKTIDMVKHALKRSANGLVYSETVISKKIYQLHGGDRKPTLLNVWTRMYAYFIDIRRSFKGGFRDAFTLFCNKSNFRCLTGF